MDNTKILSEITRKDWILYRWVEVEEFGQERRFIRGEERTPDEAMTAADEWEHWQSVKNEGNEEEEELIN